MIPERSRAYLEHILNAIHLACSYVEGTQKEDFLLDSKTQQAVILNILVMGEAATKLATEYPDFVVLHPQVPWKQMRGMRNRMAHGYFEINLDTVWETVQVSLPELQQQILAIQQQ